MKPAINKFRPVQWSEKQEKKSFKDLATLLSQSPKPAQGSAPCLRPRLWSWSSPSTGRRSGRYVHPVGVAPVPTRSGPQVTNQGYPGLSQFIWWYPWLTPDIKSYPVFRWTVEVRRGVTRPAAAARQPGAEMNETDGMSTSERISQDTSVLDYYPDLSRVIKVWPSYPNPSWDMQV